MLDRPRQFLGRRIARFRFRSQHDKVVSFSRALPAAGRVLLIMPAGPWDFSDASETLRPFLRHFTATHITVVTFPPHDGIRGLAPRSRVVHISPEDLTMFFLPRKRVIDTIRKQSYDLAVDLNLDFKLPSAYICRASGAQVRVGSAQRGSEMFFNFQVRVDPVTPPGQSYKRFMRCLQMFF
jgi:ADP-heptose:LPS heptosyltransferase